MLNMEFLVRNTRVLIIVLLFSVAVQTRRVISAAPGIETTGQYIKVIKYAQVIKYAKVLLCVFNNIFSVDTHFVISEGITKFA